MAEITPTFALASTNVVNITDFNSFRPAKYIVSLSGSVDFLQVFLDGIEHKFPTDVKNFVLDCRNYKKCMVYSEGTGAVTFTEVGEATNPFYNPDSEEDTFTPVLTCATPGDLAVTNSTEQGFYNRIGDLIFIHIYIVNTSVVQTTASGSWLITGLPFSPHTESGYNPRLSYSPSGGNYSGTLDYINAYTDTNCIKMRAYYDASSWADLAVANYTMNANRFHISGFYRRA